MIVKPTSTLTSAQAWAAVRAPIAVFAPMRFPMWLEATTPDLGYTRRRDQPLFEWRLTKAEWYHSDDWKQNEGQTPINDWVSNAYSDLWS